MPGSKKRLHSDGRFVRLVFPDRDVRSPIGGDGVNYRGIDLNISSN